MYFEGVEQASATFTVACRPVAEGRFTSWISNRFGMFACTELADDPFVRLAREYCPPAPAPAPAPGPDDVTPGAALLGWLPASVVRGRSDRDQGLGVQQ